MLKFFVIVAVISIGSFVGIHNALESGAALRYLDTHASTLWVPPIEYYIGEGYYFVHDLPEGAIFFNRVAERYASSPYADDANFGYVQCLDEQMTLSHDDLMNAYQVYLDRFPKGHYADLVTQRIETMKNNGH